MLISTTSFLTPSSEMDSSSPNFNEQDSSIRNEQQEVNDDTEMGSRSKRRCNPDPSAASSPATTTKKTRSKVWEHFTRLKDNNNKCKCHYCNTVLCCSSSSGTSSLKKHLKTCKQHHVWESSGSKQQAITPEGNLKLAKVSEAGFREATNEMLVLAELPLAFVESLAWRHFCGRVNLYKPHSRRTTTRDMYEMYASRKKSMRNVFRKSKQRVSLTTDIWTAPHTHSSYMVITAHFIDANWKLTKLIIGFKNVENHKWASISSVLLQCLEDWGIEKVFTIIVDNATTNTNALTRFTEKFKGLGDEALVLGGEFLHIRCAAHIINLVVRDGLHEVEKSVMAIRNAVQYVRANTPRLQSFESKVEVGKHVSRGSLSVDCQTRWNSTYVMLTRAQKFKTTFERMLIEDKLYENYFLEVDKEGKKRIGPPTSRDWEAIDRNKMQFAQLCFDQLYGKDSVVGKGLYESVLGVLQRMFDEYYSRFAINGKSSSGGSLSQSFASSHNSASQENIREEGLDIDGDDYFGYERMDFVYKEMVNEKGLQDSSSELDIYLRESVENPKLLPGSDYDVLRWWRINSPKFHVLAEMAKDVLAMQVSSVASESAFSTSGRILDPSRSCLTHYTREVLMCTEQWLKCEIHMDEKGVITNSELLADIELQDSLQKEFEELGFRDVT